MAEPVKFKVTEENHVVYGVRSNEMDGEIERDSERSYSEVVSKVVEISNEQLDRQDANKQSIRKIFTRFFTVFIILQFVVLSALLMFRGFVPSFDVSDELVTTYIVSVFVETLGVVASMVVFAFDTKQEVKILETLNRVVENFQKYKK